jgi:hypothetical protein
LLPYVENNVKTQDNPSILLVFAEAGGRAIGLVERKHIIVGGEFSRAPGPELQVGHPLHLFARVDAVVLAELEKLVHAHGAHAVVVGKVKRAEADLGKRLHDSKHHIKGVHLEDVVCAYTRQALLDRQDVSEREVYTGALPHPDSHLGEKVVLRQHVLEHLLGVVRQLATTAFQGALVHDNKPALLTVRLDIRILAQLSALTLRRLPLARPLH